MIYNKTVKFDTKNINMKRYRVYIKPIYKQQDAPDKADS